jgi:hypothetical protein
MDFQLLRSPSLWLTLILGIACGKSTPPPAPPLVCNGHVELCDRRYDQVAYPGTHDAYSDTTEKFLAPDQTYPLARQLEDGIRVLHIEVQFYNGQVLACHGLCELGRKPLVDEMQHIADFVAAHPHEVVSLLLERSDPQITADQIGEAMKSAGLEKLMHVQTAGAPWPTLRELITRGDRVIALLDNTTGSSFPWLMPRWQWTWETPWDNEIPRDFGRCNADRGTRGNSLYVVDTYMEDVGIQSAQSALRVNYDPFLIDRVLTCQQSQATLPNFVMINFYEVSDLFHVVDVLNGFASPPTDLPSFPPCVFEDGGGVAVHTTACDAGLPDGG